MILDDRCRKQQIDCKEMLPVAMPCRHPLQVFSVASISFGLIWMSGFPRHLSAWSSLDLAIKHHPRVGGEDQSFSTRPDVRDVEISAGDGE